ncbi:MAG TPA: LPS assembly protein LptD [Thermoanaerobaculia bacterium]|nr:LPS assembly protein LptD [Thermoanaerobaculia bacterium]
MNLRSAPPVLLVLLTISIPLAAQRSRFEIIPAPRQGGGEVKITVAEGGRFETQPDEYSVLEGEVTIEYQDIKLRANKVTYNNRTKDVTAEGNVIIDQGPTRIAATQAVYNLESKVGTFFNATGTMHPELHFSGSRIEKVDEDTYRLTDGVFTSCDLDRPAWSFHVASAEVTLNDYAYLRNVSFRARRLPILWAPRLLWPTKSERSRGLLIPRLHFSNVSNMRVELGYFVPFGDSVDATVTADLTSVGHYGGGVNVRYLPSQNVKLGELDFYGVFGPDIDSSGLPGQTGDDEFRWRYRWQHAQDNLPRGFRGVIDIQDFSDLEFFRRFDRNPELTTLSNIYSSAYLTKNQPRYSLNIRADRRELVFATRQHFEQLPALQLRLYPQRVFGSPLYFSMESSASHLRTNSVAGTTDTTAYYRADVFPTLSLQMKTPPWFSIRPQISARGTYYSASLERDPITQRNVLSEEGIDRLYTQGQVEVVGPSLSRIFNRQIRGFSRFKHVIEPRFRYVYTSGSDRESQEQIIRFDTVDSPFLPIVRDTLEYSLTQRIIGKEAGPNGPAREVLSLSLRQAAALSKPFTTATGSSSAFAEHRFTPLDATLRVNPYQSVTVDATARFGNVSRQLDQTSLSANLVGTGRRAGEYLSLTWFATYGDPQTSFGDSSQFRVSTGGTFLDDRLRADLQVNYDARENKFIEQRYILGGTGSCYGIALSYRRFLIYPRGIETTDWSVGAAITLKNVGTIGSLR